MAVYRTGRFEIFHDGESGWCVWDRQENELVYHGLPSFEEAARLRREFVAWLDTF